MTMEHKNSYAPLAMAAVAIPAYTAPLVAMGQIGSMFQHANSVGSAFVLLTLGAGVNLGLLAWMFVNYGVKRSSSFMAILLAIVLAIAYAIENPLYPSQISPPGHTHAFDIYCRPFTPDQPDLPHAFTTKIAENFGPADRFSLSVLGVLVAIGITLKIADRRWRVEEWLERGSLRDPASQSWHDVTVPAPVLGAIALLGLVAISIVGCYAYYLPKDEVFEELAILKGEVLTAAIGSWRFSSRGKRHSLSPHESQGVSRSTGIAQTRCRRRGPRRDPRICKNRVRGPRSNAVRVPRRKGVARCRACAASGPPGTILTQA
jgi:hypothetical protein